MNRKLLEFFKFLELSPETIDELYELCPKMFSFDSGTVIENIGIVIAFGFPKHEIGDLLLENPYFVFNTSEILKGKLLNIKGDVEHELKTNPYLI